MAGTASRAVTVDDIMLAIGMVAALLAKTPSGSRRATADAAWSLLRGGLLA